MGRNWIDSRFSSQYELTSLPPITKQSPTESLAQASQSHSLKVVAIVVHSPLPKAVCKIIHIVKIELSKTKTTKRHMSTTMLKYLHWPVMYSPVF